VSFFNGRHGRTGMLWGRYQACLVDNADDVLRRSRYIALNQIRMRITEYPAAYAASYPAPLDQRQRSALTPHPCWLALGKYAAEHL